MIAEKNRRHNIKLKYVTKYTEYQSFFKGRYFLDGKEMKDGNFTLVL